jgi:hypothetical protein
MGKIGRNDPCPCGSGKKYKKCHWQKASVPEQVGASPGRNYSRIQDHTRDGKTLVPPFLKIQNLHPMSWANDRLPELLWAALLVTHLPREEALAGFRNLGAFIHSLPEKERFGDVTHSGLASLPIEMLKKVIGIILSTPSAAIALTPLCLLDRLPARDVWREVLAGATPVLDWDALKFSVARTIFHQSEAATDCRWLRVLIASIAGKLIFPSGDSELADEILRYPHFGDLRKVRPTIRATEGTLAIEPENSTTWPSQFWVQCMKDTTCFPLGSAQEGAAVELGTTDQRLQDLYLGLIRHCHETRTTTSVDSRHDTVFGTALYCVSILRELLRPGSGVSVIGRPALRTLTDCFVTLAYLLSKDSAELWKSYRAYGAGQAKLSFLKLVASSDKPTSIDVQTLSDLANEDAWQELVPIDLGHWDKSDLRTMSEQADVKDVYDKFYGWTSTYSHGQWCAVRDAVFDTCGNPLHRLHRIPRQEARHLPDVVVDACYLVDREIELVSRAYPEFALRALIK